MKRMRRKKKECKKIEERGRGEEKKKIKKKEGKE